MFFFIFKNIPRPADTPFKKGELDTTSHLTTKKIACYFPLLKGDKGGCCIAILQFPNFIFESM